MEMMQKMVDSFAGKCKKMPKQLREWDAYHELKKEIEDFQTVLPLLTDLSKPSIMPRHWAQVRSRLIWAFIVFREIKVTHR